MKKNSLVLALLSLFLLSSCNQNEEEQNTKEDDPQTQDIEPIEPIEPTQKTIKSIAEVRSFIENTTISANSYNCGVDNTKAFTIQGFAVAKVNLEKTTSKFGLNVSYPAKTFIADSSGYIACASPIANGSLFAKVNNHQCKDTSKYEVTGYISIYLGQPELVVTSFTYDETLDIAYNATSLAKSVLSIEEVYSKAVNVNYNCAGHGYGEVYTLRNLTCYYSESDGQGIRYYNFTDGNKSIRVNAYNISNASVGCNYDITGLLSLQNLSPCIIAFSINTVNGVPHTINYENKANDISITDLHKIKGSQDDTDTKYPDVINCYQNFYKTTGYLGLVEENGKYYVGISDTYHKNIITGKNNASLTYGITLIKNENFWNVTESELMRFNSYYDEYILLEKEITIYYVTRQLRYSSKKPIWEILLLPNSIPELVK